MGAAGPWDEEQEMAAMDEQITADKRAELLAEHYQKTYELTHELWKQRNSTLLLLLGVVGAATLLTLHVPGMESLLVGFITKNLNITKSDLEANVSFSILQSVLLFVVFYLMVNLHHRALYVLRNYRYLGALEGEIRVALGLGENAVSFTRESSFYWHARTRLLDYTKFFYIVLLGALLVAFFVGRIADDLAARNSLLSAVDLVMGVSTLVFFVGYAWGSVRLDVDPYRKAGAGEGSS